MILSRIESTRGKHRLRESASGSSVYVCLVKQKTAERLSKVWHSYKSLALVDQSFPVAKPKVKRKKKKKTF